MTLYIGCITYSSDCVSVSLNMVVHRASFYMKPKCKVPTVSVEFDVKFWKIREQSLKELTLGSFVITLLCLAVHEDVVYLESRFKEATQLYQVMMDSVNKPFRAYCNRGFSKKVPEVEGDFVLDSVNISFRSYLTGKFFKRRLKGICWFRLV